MSKIDDKKPASALESLLSPAKKLLTGLFGGRSVEAGSNPPSPRAIGEGENSHIEPEDEEGFSLLGERIALIAPQKELKSVQEASTILCNIIGCSEKELNEISERAYFIDNKTAIYDALGHMKHMGEVLGIDFSSKEKIDAFIAKPRDENFNRNAIMISWNAQQMALTNIREYLDPSIETYTYNPRGLDPEQRKLTLFFQNLHKLPLSFKEIPADRSPETLIIERMSDTVPLPKYFRALQTTNLQFYGKHFAEIPDIIKSMPNLTNLILPGTASLKPINNRSGGEITIKRPAENISPYHIHSLDEFKYKKSDFNK